MCFALLLTSALFSRGLCGQFLFQMLFALLLTICPLCGLCGLYFDLACFTPCFQRLPSFHVAFAGNFDFVCYFICCCGRNLFNILFALLLNVCLLSWGLCGQFWFRVICPAVNDLPSLWALWAITWFGLLFTLLLTSALFPCGLCGQFCFRMLFYLLLRAIFRLGFTAVALQTII